MRPNKRFAGKPKSFWATVRSVSQRVGYSKNARIVVPGMAELRNAFTKMNLDPDCLGVEERPTIFARDLMDYFDAHSKALMQEAEPSLMNVDEARKEFSALKAEFNPQCPIPMNKQRGEKKAEAYLTGIVNMMVEHYSCGLPCDYDPRELTNVIRNGQPLRTLSRRLDGAFPSATNPIAVWEIKEYYHTTTFGSRVADGVYETLLDGMEIEEIRENEAVDIKHYLMVDSRYTWWECGKSYLCRLFDMLHMGYVDEILFGRQVVKEMPRIVGEWVSQYKNTR